MLIISLGDPWSVNVELVVKCLSSRFASYRSKIILLGSFWHWQDQTQKLGFNVAVQKITKFQEAKQGSLNFMDCGGESKDAALLSNKERGDIAVKALYALQDILNLKRSETDKLAILTCPIDKKACHEAGFEFPGHTEYFTELSHCKTLMLLAGPRLRVGLATNHLALRDVAKSITAEILQHKLTILYQALQKFFGITEPKIAVCGLNPHCGDGGLFGDEESRVIAPAILAFHKTHKLKNAAFGPMPADTIFYRAASGHFDAVLALYHDQGLGPLKTLHFDEAINISCGLPYLRLSPDHGPAKDLFLQNKASIQSMEEALRFASTYLGESL